MHTAEAMSLTRIVFAHVLLLSASAVAQEHQHSPIHRLGEVHFATSCDRKAQPQFDRAVALLHSFEYSNAIAGFNAVLAHDPKCGIAHWGIALSQWSNPFAAGSKDKTQLQAGRASVQQGIATGAGSGPVRSDTEKRAGTIPRTLWSGPRRATCRTPRSRSKVLPRTG